MNPIRKHLGLALAAACLLWPGLAAAQGNCPAKTVKFVVPFPGSGSSADVLSRALASSLSKQWAMSVVVDNRPGGASVPATQNVAASEPNGCTLGLVYSALAINHTLMKGRLPYDTLKDLAPVTQLVELPQGIFAAPSFPVNTIAELVQYAKTKPEGLTFGTPGVGSSSHLAGVMLGSLTGAKLLHVPYKGMAPAKIDVLGGRVDLVIGAISTELAAVKSGELKLIAVANDKRFKEFPQVPTVTESVPQFEIGGYFGVVVAGKTPPALVSKLSRDLGSALKSPEVQAVLSTLKLDAVGSAPDVFSAVLKSDIETMAKIISATGLKAE